VTAQAEIEVGLAPTALYRLYSESGELLYVGITDQLKTRFAAHAKDKPRWPEVARKTAAWHASKDEAVKAEARAIAEERPAHNTAAPAVPGPAATPPPHGQRHGWNRNPLVGWHPPAELSEWARSEASRQGRRLSDLLTDALRDYRFRLEGGSEGGSPP
jgi:predicted GIY-YIG superfamily endonuclease